MVTRDPRVDAYIEQAPDFARPVLTELRARMHAACPDVVETIKWRVPSFEHGGLLGGMAAFKGYCMFGFWKDPLLRENADGAAVLEALGRVTKVGELPPRRAFGKVVRQAMQLNAAGTAVPRKPKTTKAKIVMHPELATALAAKPAAKKRFSAFAPGQQREYLEWIADAKKDDTRARRIEQAVAWIAEGKKRNWKYETC